MPQSEQDNNSNILDYLSNTPISNTKRRKIIHTRSGRDVILQESDNSSSIGENLGPDNTTNEINHSLDDGSVYETKKIIDKEGRLHIKETAVDECRNGHVVPKENLANCPWCDQWVCKKIPKCRFKIFNNYYCNFLHYILYLLFGGKKDAKEQQK